MKIEEVSRSPVMVYVKHQIHGNRHVVGTEVDALVAAGWVVWPRTKAEKEGLPVQPQEAHQPDAADAPVAQDAAPPVAVRRGPGRPPKVRA